MNRLKVGLSTTAILTTAIVASLAQSKASADTKLLADGGGAESQRVDDLRHV